MGNISGRVFAATEKLQPLNKQRDQTRTQRAPSDLLLCAPAPL